MPKHTEITLREQNTAIAALQLDPTSLLEALRENIGAEPLSPADLDRVKVPAGGATYWSVPTLDNPEGEPAKAITGVIVVTSLRRAYWREAFADSGGGNPPDCYSDDSVTGVGNPGGTCATCPHAQFGSGIGGAGQACKQFRELYLLREGHSGTLPTLVVVSPASLKPVKKYLFALANEGLTYWSVVTELSLAQAKSKTSGITYSQIVPRLSRRLNPEEVARAKAYSEAIKPVVLSAATVDRSAVDG